VKKANGKLKFAKMGARKEEEGGELIVCFGS
jgi:hypothetical protein